MDNKTLWLVLTVVWALLAVPAAGGALLSPMMFDAPGSTESPLTVALFWCVLVAPVTWLLGAGVPWIFRSKPFGLWLFLIPFVDIAAIVVVIVLMQQHCGGNFACK